MTAIFDTEVTADKSQLILLPIGWDATTSYHAGTALGPQAIATASQQLDFYDWQWGDYTHKGLFFDQEFLHATLQLNQTAREAAQSARTTQSEDALKLVNSLSEQLNKLVYERSQYWLQQGKKVGVVGGEHSVPYGYLKALSEVHSFGILHFDAHYDYRPGYEGFTHSHASIMWHASQLKGVTHLSHVGIRDFCSEEKEYAQSANPGQASSRSWLGPEIAQRLFQGERWHDISQEIVASLPDKVYISFDVDGLDPQYCPSTGTPVPGGLSYDQAIYLLELIAKTPKTLVGFDLCEVCPSRDGYQWDENVGARLLYKLCGLQLN